MNITQETNDYFSTTEETEFIKHVNKQIEEAGWDKFEVNKKNRGLINWSKVFKRGWLLWK